MNWLLKISTKDKAKKLLNSLLENLDIENLSRIEHEQWEGWSKSVADEVDDERAKRWKQLWVDYDELSETEKDKDRQEAKKIINPIKKIVKELKEEINKL